MFQLLIDDLGADSLDTVELVMAFEEKFELKFLMMAETIQTVQTLSILLKVKNIFNFNEKSCCHWYGVTINFSNNY